MKILLLGGSGFIGKNFLEQLSGKYKITAPNHKQLDLLDKQAVESFLREGNFEVVIHAANFGGSRAQSALTGVFETNKQMFLNVAENSDLFGRMIFLGSGAEYGKQKDIVNIKEEDFGKIKPEDEYGRAKYFASEYIEKSSNIINLRLFGVFGKYEDYSIRFISQTICRVILNLPININQNVFFDYLYVNDLIGIIEGFITSEPKEKFYNVGTGERVDILSILKIIEQVTGKKLEVNVQKPGLNKEYTCSISRLQQEFPNIRYTPLTEAIAELYNWYLQNQNNINADLLKG